jgi:lipoate-protein ligase A
VRSYGRFGAPIVAALREAGVDARWAPAFGLSDQFCLFGGRGEVLAVDDRALGGAAQHLTRTAFLHHGVVGGRLDRSALAELFDVASEPLQQRLTSFEERGGSDTLDRVGRRSLEAWAKDPEGGHADVSPSRSA